MGLTQELVRKYMIYEDGKLFWKQPGRGIRVGMEVGCLKSDGYRVAKLRSSLHSVHRLVFLYHHGYLPENPIDHINRVKDDNRIENLREVSQSCNLRNSGLSIRNTSGVKGVSFCNTYKKWLAKIYINGKNNYLGSYDTKLEAVCHRLAAEQCLDWNKCDTISHAYKYVKENI